MLAARVPFPVDYLVFPTLLSFLVCVIVVGVAVFAISAGPLDADAADALGRLMGAGIFSMHYIGMSALHASASMVHAPLCSWRPAWRSPSPPRVWRCGSPMDAARAAAAHPLGGRLRHRRVRHALHRHGRHDAFPVRADAVGGAGAVDRPAGDRRCRRCLFPLGDIPPCSWCRIARASGRRRWTARCRCRRAPRGSTAMAPRLAGRPTSSAAARRNSAAAPMPRSAAPAHRRRAWRAICRSSTTAAPTSSPSRTIVAVHANAHYTYVFNGTAKLFCPLAIGEVEQRLDKARFIRVHRSHIVNIERVTGYRRNGDNELVEMAAGRSLYGAGQPQPGGLAEGAHRGENRHRRTPAGRSGQDFAPQITAADARKRQTATLATGTLTRFVRALPPFVQRSPRFRAATLSFVHRILLLRRTVEQHSPSQMDRAPSRGEVGRKPTGPGAREEAP